MIQVLTPRTWGANLDLSVSVFVTSGIGEPLSTATLTYALYRPSTSRWWNATTVEWQVGRVENDMTEIAADTGVFRAVVDMAGANPSWQDIELVLLVQSDVPEYATHMIKLQHTLATMPVADAEIANPVARLGDLLSLLRATYAHDREVDPTTNRLIVFRQDGETSAIEFALKDAAGAGTSREPFRRERV